jgi:uncharacterized membrane protein
LVRNCVVLPNITRIVPNGLTLSLIAVLLLIFSGWKGGDLVFRGRIGVAG